ncbi:MAG: hypothetical protein M1816_006486 [Peltula sp. TS41687]|nr:MAG: hypothetical protein M1816_006486 [Peltula sp. TS41687]
MAPGPRVKVEEDVSLINLSSQEDAADDDDRPRYRYYKSTKVLGELYRAIDEHDFLEELQASTKTWNPDAPNVLAKLWAYVRLEVVGFQWSHHLSTARDIKEIYEDNLTDLMYKYSATPWSSTLTELEVFIGNIMGKEHRQSKRQREASTTMREEYDRLVQFIIAQILDKESGGEESLERAVACLAVAVDEYKQEQYLYPPGSRRRGNTTKLRSFRWIAAAVCLQEVEKLQKLDGY